ncbi:hypothetical protein DFQ13_103691 [Actinokineospora spheciospongiae]|nr:hypothetical protein DFQ13_103691 [Actinokineospora spheciospongiae]
MKTIATAVLTASLALVGFGLVHVTPSDAGSLGVDSTATQVELTSVKSGVPASGERARTLDWPWI